MTEEEARRKECPVRTYCVNEDGVIHTGQSPLYAQAPCRGSDCILWRWTDRADERRAQFGSPGEHWVEEKGTGRDAERDLIPAWRREWPDGQRPGFCGLAGSPQ